MNEIKSERDRKKNQLLVVSGRGNFCGHYGMSRPLSGQQKSVRSDPSSPSILFGGTAKSDGATKHAFQRLRDVSDCEKVRLFPMFAADAKVDLDGFRMLDGAQENSTVAGLTILGTYRKRQRLVAVLEALKRLKTLRETDQRLRELFEVKVEFHGFEGSLSS